MNPVVKILERYVQWIVLGLALLWVAWVGWSYWANEPVTVSVARQNVVPQRVDQLAKEKLLDPYLAQELADQKKEAEIKRDPRKDNIKVPVSVPPFAAEMKAAMAANFLSMRDVKSDLAGLDFFPTPLGGQGFISEQGPALAGAATVPAFAPPGPVVPLGAVAGTSVALVPDPAGAPPAAPGAAPAAPAAPGAAPAAPGGQPGQVPLKAVDLTWVTMSFKIDMEKVRDAWKAAHIPDNPSTLWQTEFLRVELYRQEMKADGTFPADTNPGTLIQLVQPLAEPYPGSAKEAQMRYAKGFVVQHQMDILRPAFFQLQPPPFRGTAWHTITQPDPDAANPAPGAAAQPFDPANPPADRPLTAEEMRLVNAYKAKQAEEERRAADQARREAAAAAAAAKRAAASGGRGGTRPPPVRPPTPTPTPTPAAPTPGNPAGPAAPAAPAGPAAPAAPAVPDFGPMVAPPAGFCDVKMQGNFEFWAFDAGPSNAPIPTHTYRYRVVVKVLNPLFDQKDHCKKASDADVFEVVTSSPWGDPVAVPPLFYFFVGENPINNPSKVKIEIFDWKAGKWNMDARVLTPGDSIGDSKWTVGDIRVDGPRGEPRIICTNEDGAVQIRTFKADSMDAIHRTLRAQADAAKAAAGAPAGPN